MSDVYNTNIQISYSNTCEYRNAIRILFKMDIQKLLKKFNDEYCTETIDEETKDELLYDNEKAVIVMDKIFDLTKNNKLFTHLYELAAARMLSNDHLIGECILFSYDYLYLYHPCLCVYINNPLDFNEKCPYYIELLQKLQKK